MEATWVTPLMDETVGKFIALGVTTTPGVTGLDNSTMGSPDTEGPPTWMLNIHIILLFASSFLIITSNLVVLLVFHFNQSLHDVTGIFVQSLAVADLGVGIGCVVSIHAWFKDQEELPYPQRFCTFTGFVLSAVIIVSILCLLLLSIDRYIAVTRPFQYDSILTRRRGYICVFLVWTFSYAVFLPTIFLDNSYWYNTDTFECSFRYEGQVMFSSLLIGLVVIPAFSTSGYCYYHVLRTCWRHQRQIRKVSTYFQGEESNEATTIHKDGNLAKVFLVVVSGYYITWLPFLIVKVLKGYMDITIPPSIYFFSQWLGEFNSFINCIVYSIGHASFRECFKKMISAGRREVAKKLWQKDQRKKDQRRRRRQSTDRMVKTESVV
ncbi:putative G-protein coupled receptor [Apostichopus japonicus]|uniref:Putative G-protein coupled receptor n=1 Tax=Stichopus japonicus TaxID=307972 RepID=A0A2G8JU49_STIJA|nr:putative G-protein coupled receptor [Apostichopus japonicus]